MTENKLVSLRQEGAIDDPLTDILRAGARSHAARQSGWEGSDNQDGDFGGRGEVMIVAARR